jgi:hypothetical protein
LYIFQFPPTIGIRMIFIPSLFPSDRKVTWHSAPQEIPEHVESVHG